MMYIHGTCICLCTYGTIHTYILTSNIYTYIHTHDDLESYDYNYMPIIHILMYNMGVYFTIPVYTYTLTVKVSHISLDLLQYHLPHIQK